MAIIGIWQTQAEINALPAAGAPYTALVAAANKTLAAPSTTDPDGFLADQNSQHDQIVFAKALVFARTGTASYRTTVQDWIRNVVNSGTYGGRALGLGRNLAGYVIAADLIDLPAFDATLNTQFRAKILELRDAPTTESGSIKNCHNIRPTNWGAMCGASRIAVDLYLADSADLALAANVLKGWCGDRTAWAGFKWSSILPLGAGQYWTYGGGDLADIVPVGPLELADTVKLSLDGFLHCDMYRTCEQTKCTPPPIPPLPKSPELDYPWSSLSGVITQAWMLNRTALNGGYTPFTFSNSAIKRAVLYLKFLADTYDDKWWDPARTFDTGLLWVVNKIYGAATVPTTAVSRYTGSRQIAGDFSDWWAV